MSLCRIRLEFDTNCFDLKCSCTQTAPLAQPCNLRLLAAAALPYNTARHHLKVCQWQHERF